MSDVALETEELTKRFGARTAVNRLNNLAVRAVNEKHLGIAAADDQAVQRRIDRHSRRGFAGRDPWFAAGPSDT